jgi:hypothetical protein
LHNRIKHHTKFLAKKVAILHFRVCPQVAKKKLKRTPRGLCKHNKFCILNVTKYFAFHHSKVVGILHLQNFWRKNGYSLIWILASRGQKKSTKEPQEAFMRAINSAF